MEPTGAWEELIKQGPLVAFMVIVIFFGAKFVKKMLDDQTARETAREARYNQLIDKSLENAEKQATSLTTVVANNTAVLQRVEVKLNEKSNGG